jgi:hypothetical protein
MEEIINSFDIHWKLLEIPSIIFVMEELKGRSMMLWIDSVGVVGKCVIFNRERISNERKISIIESLLILSMKYLKATIFLIIEQNMKIVFFEPICSIFRDIVVLLGVELPNEYPDLIRSIFETSGWTEWLIHIFNALNVLSSSSRSSLSLPPSLSFLSSVSPSEETDKITRCVAITIKKLCMTNTPEAVNKYLELTSFN